MSIIVNAGSDPILVALWPRGEAASRRGGAGTVGSTAVGDTVSIGSVIGSGSQDSGTYSEQQVMGLNGSGEKSANEPDASEQQMVRDLEARDRDVRAHEQTHAALLGRYAIGGPSYVYQTGPDGKAYAVGGSILADIGPGATPGETAAKAQILGRAAMGVADPSGADGSVAAAASRMRFNAIA